MTLFDRLKVSAALGAILILVAAIAGFLGAPRLFRYILESTLFFWVFLAASMVAAPLFARYVPIRNERGWQIRPIGFIIFAVAGFIGVIALIVHMVTL